MAYTKSLMIGPVYTLTQNIVYALPARSCFGFVQGSGVQQSNDGTTWTATTLDTNNIFTAVGGFVRSTAVDSTIVLKAQ